MERRRGGGSEYLYRKGYNPPFQILVSRLNFAAPTPIQRCARQVECGSIDYFIRDRKELQVCPSYRTPACSPKAARRPTSRMSIITVSNELSVLVLETEEEEEEEEGYSGDDKVTLEEEEEEKDRGQEEEKAEEEEEKEKVEKGKEEKEEEKDVK
ncbi:hypothetical protein O3P69_014309 [Scylla paramamosain]|uniref:Uncharacterized protein n=1 Tax=Scylla paramamosain TaxID=85552 RepID=A0AAW0TDF5_SCYPA